MRLRWFPDNSVALRADNFALLSRFSFGPTALLDEVGFSSHFVFPIIITEYKIDVQINKHRRYPTKCSLQTQTYFRLSRFSPPKLFFGGENLDSRKYVCVRRLNKMVKELITLEREHVQNCEKIFTGGDRKK